MVLTYSIINLIGLFCLGLFIKSYFPSYMSQKGKNLAEKEDIEEITKKTEEVKIELKKEFQAFSGKVEFDFNYCYEQYSKLYANLYAIISQSEYLRYFFNEYQGLELDMHDIPFIEMEINKNEERHETEITIFNKKLIHECIINNAGLASPELLKLTAAYRFAKTYYSGNGEKLEGEDIKDAFNNEELKLIREIVKRIIREYNLLRMKLKLDYSKEELETGILDSKEWNK